MRSGRRGKVMAFSDDLIRAIVKTGQFSDPKAEQYLADVLIKRRDKIGQAYLPKINPIVDPGLDASGTLTFANAAVDARVAERAAGLHRDVVRVRQRDRRVEAARRDQRRRRRR